MLLDSEARAKTTKALTGATGVNSNSLDHGDAYAELDPVTIGVHYPADPTGTGPTVKAEYAESTDNSTFVVKALIHDTLSGAANYPSYRQVSVVPKARYWRVQWTLANADNNYGTVAVYLDSKASHIAAYV